MAVSGSTDFTLNRDGIITAGLQKLRLVGAGQSARSNDITLGASILNLLIKELQMKGVGIWLDQEVVLHLTEDAQSYTLGPSGVNCSPADDIGSTQLAAASAANDTTLTVDSITDIADSDNIGIELDDGSLEWTTVSGTPTGTTVTIATGVTSAAGIDNYVFHYTSKITRPLEILEARLRDTNNNDIPIFIHQDRDSFMSITDKTATGDCTDVYYDPQITNGVLYTWPTCDDVQKRIYMTIRRVINDFDAQANNFDGPVECLGALVDMLALKMSPYFQKEPSAQIVAESQEGLRVLKSFYGKKKDVQFSPA